MTSRILAFDYEDFMEEVIQSKLQDSLKYDPSGKLGELQAKPRRLQQQSWRAKFDDSSQHTHSPYLIIDLDGPSTYSLSQPYRFKATLTHRQNLVGNPENRAVIFPLEQAALQIESSDTSQYMVLQHRENKPPRELQPVYGQMPPEPDEDLNTTETFTKAKSEIRLEVGSSYVTDVTYDFAKDWGESLEKDQEYSLCFKNSRIPDWEWDTAERSTEEQNQKEKPGAVEKQPILIPTSNRIDFTTKS